METYSHIETMAGLDRCAVFRVPTKDQGDVWMRMSGEFSNRAVVEVDAERFVSVWRLEGSSHTDIARQSVDGWKRDYKFASARDGFARGWVNPVPLASVSASLQRDKTLIPPLRPTHGMLPWFRRPVGHAGIDPATASAPCLGFTNGITRTIWLLAHGAERFPVSCTADDAVLLHQLAGAEGTEPHAVRDLVPEIDHLEKLAEHDAFLRKLEAHGLPPWAS
ncbi:plasmid fertility inhibition factor family protein [Burkholderia glumae]|uniref:plasmid fertility inhibition factor family protein n=1 Tax=Burkholderia glumae TaxID=337 RepID=UPI002150F4FC|nr:hypothetical protein [Burkholderia glumae]